MIKPNNQPSARCRKNVSTVMYKVNVRLAVEKSEKGA